MMKIGYLGPRGTFSQEALMEYVKNVDNHMTIDYNNIPDMICAVQSGDVDEVVTPIENSLEGAVNETLDILASEAELKIKAELIIAIRENLLVRKGTCKNDITSIVSHPQAIGQCRRYIASHFPNAGINLVYSTAGAALEVAQGKGNFAAIGSVTAAEVYGLDVLAYGIQDADNNSTRFVVVSKQDSRRTGRDKTSIVFSTEDRPGSLYRILDIFNLWDINMTRIESRPAKNQLGRYIFFVDIDGHKEDEDVKSALTMVRRKTSFYKFVGSYPAYR